MVGVCLGPLPLPPSHAPFPLSLPPPFPTSALSLSLSLQLSGPAVPVSCLCHCAQGGMWWIVDSCRGWTSPLCCPVWQFSFHQPVSFSPAWSFAGCAFVYLRVCWRSVDLVHLLTMVTWSFFFPIMYCVIWLFSVFVYSLSLKKKKSVSCF